jgi:ABC-type transport system involved in Fe-S cluster assembly fused permease/ATPase subunit
MLVTLIQRYVSARIGESLIFDLRRRVFGHVQRMPIAFFSRTQTGALVSRLNNDIIGAQQAFTNTLGSVVSNIITVAIVLVAMLALSWEITLASLALLPLFVIPARLVGKKLQAITRERYMVSAEMNNTMTERFNVSGALLVKLFGTPALEQRGFEDKAARVRTWGHLEPVQRLLLLGDVPAHVARDRTGVRLGWSLSVEGVLDIGTVVALTAYLQRLYGPLNQLSSVQIDVMTALVSFDRVFEILDLEPMIDDKPGAIDVPPGPARIQFDHVDFHYRGPTKCHCAARVGGAVLDQTPNHQVLSDVSFTVEPGELVALVGHSGAGKTTISNLVPLYDVQSGAIRINGVDVRDATLAPMRETIGVVTQDAHLFHDSIRANLSSRPEATEVEMRQALGAAQILPGRRSPTASTPSSAIAATASPAGRNNGSRSRVCSSKHRASSCSTKPPRTSTPNQRSRCKLRSKLRSPVEPRSSSRTGCRRCATPTRSWWCRRVALSRAARTMSSSRVAACTRISTRLSSSGRPRWKSCPLRNENLAGAMPYFRAIRYRRWGRYAALGEPDRDLRVWPLEPTLILSLDETSDRLSTAESTAPRHGLSDDGPGGITEWRLHPKPGTDRWRTCRTTSSGSKS